MRLLGLVLIALPFIWATAWSLRDFGWERTVRIWFMALGAVGSFSVGTYLFLR